MGFLDNLKRQASQTAQHTVSHVVSDTVRGAVHAAMRPTSEKITNSVRETVYHEWTCACGTRNNSKFCKSCGKGKTEITVKCAKCGWETKGAVPKFCPDCGNNISNQDSDLSANK